METKVLSSGVHYSNLPESYIRPESERPLLSEVSSCDDVPIIDLGCEDRSQVVKQIGDACKSYGFFQEINHGVSSEEMERMLAAEKESFGLPVEEKMKLDSDDPSKTMRFSTSFSVRKEKVHNWGDSRRLHCYHPDEHGPEWPSTPPAIKQGKTRKGRTKSDSLEEILAKCKKFNDEHDSGKDGVEVVRKAPAKGSKKGCMKGKGGPENMSFKYRGVRQRTWGSWVSEIRLPANMSREIANGKERLWLGSFDSAYEGACAYDNAAKVIFGHKAELNFPENDVQSMASEAVLTSSDNMKSSAIVEKSTAQQFSSEVCLSNGFNDKCVIDCLKTLNCSVEDYFPHQLQNSDTCPPESSSHMQEYLDGNYNDDVSNFDDFGLLTQPPHSDLHQACDMEIWNPHSEPNWLEFIKSD